MFTGIIEKKGKVLVNAHSLGTHRLIIASDYQDLQIGESIAVNGVCLTLLPSEPDQLSFDLSPETVQCTTLSSLLLNDEVNLERAMLASTRFGGHYVSGHVDVKAQVNKVQHVDEFVSVELGAFDEHALFYLIPKGSITVEGVSLTINAIEQQTIQLMLVPHTLQETTLSLLKLGQWVNIEFDYLTRIVAHQLAVAGQLRIKE